MPVEVVHQSRGRLRVRVDGQLDGRADGLRRSLERLSGIGPVRVSRPTGTVVVHHDPSWTPDSVLGEVAEHAARPPSADESCEGRNGHGPRREIVELVGAAAALALSGADGLVPLKLGLLAVGGRSIVARTVRSLIDERRLTVDALDTAAIGLLAMQGMYPYAAFVTTLVTTAEVIRAATQERSRQAIADVMGHLETTAWVERGTEIVEIDAANVSTDDVVLLSVGDRVPVDGVVLDGKIIVDQQALTGESVPVERSEGDDVFAATAVCEGRARVRPRGIGANTRVANIAALISNAPADDTRVQNYAARWANRMVPFSFLAGGVALVAGGPARAATVMVIDYGAGFRVSAPTTVMASMTKAARRGILIRGGRHLERLAEIDAVVLDKTGTLTVGFPAVAMMTPFNGAKPHDVLAVAASAEQRLNHPVAEALVAAADAHGLHLPHRSDVEYTIGQGVEATIDGAQVLVGSHRFLAQQGIGTCNRWASTLEAMERQAMSPVCIARNGEHFGALALADPVREESARVVARLRAQGVKHIAMVTGDRRAVAEEIASQVGIDIVVAEAFPEQKLDVVAELQSRGLCVGVVGDGINDGPALAHADVGIAVNGGTAVAQESSDVVLLRGDLHQLPEAIDIAREGIALVRQNWQLIRMPNSIGLGLALAGVVGPVGAALISDGAAIAAGVNSLRPLASGARRDSR